VGDLSRTAVKGLLRRAGKAQLVGTAHPDGVCRMKFAVNVLVLGAGLWIAAPVVASDLGRDTARWQQQEIDLALAPIKSHAELQRHVRTAADSPLAKLSTRDRTAFIDSFVFTDKGLASYSWLPIAGKLSVADTYRLLALFGLQSMTSGVPTLAPVNEIEHHVLDISPVRGDFKPQGLPYLEATHRREAR